MYDFGLFPYITKIDTHEYKYFHSNWLVIHTKSNCFLKSNQGNFDSIGNQKKINQGQRSDMENRQTLQSMK